MDDATSWSGTAQLKWYALGSLVGEDLLAFEVECPILPEDERLQPVELRRLATLQLACAEAERYGIPPRVVTIRLIEDDLLPVGMDRARWRADSGGFCHGAGILQVAAPPAGSRLILKVPGRVS